MAYMHSEITDVILGAFYDVYNYFGYGFLEKVYRKALVIEIGKRGLAVADEVKIPVYYHDALIAEYYADLIVADKVLVELKAADALAKEHEAQLLNYLGATTYEVGLLLNFGPEPQKIRKAYDNHRKGAMRWQTKS